MTTAILQYALCAVLVIAIVALVLTGHDAAQGTIALTAGLSVIIGFLFRDATGTLIKTTQNKQNGPAGNNGSDQGGGDGAK